MKKVLIIAYPPLDRDPRPNRQINWLKDKYIVHTLASKESGFEHKFIRIKKITFYEELLRLPLLALGFFKTFYWDKYKKKLLKEIVFDAYDLIIVHEVRLLPLALRISKNSKIFLDAHEYSPENFNDQFFWRVTYGKYYRWLCNKHINSCDLLITVSEGIANLYRENYEPNVTVITNATEHKQLFPTEVDENNIKIIYHGNCSSSRKLELMVEAAKQTKNNTHFYLMLVYSRSSRNYFFKLKRLANNLNNVHFLEPVDYDHLVNFSNYFDLGIQFHPPVNVNLEYGLGNKFFEFIQSRLGIIIGPSEEMSKYVNKYDLGVIVKDFNPHSLAFAINNLTVEQIVHFKAQAHHFAKELSASKEKEKFIGLVESSFNNQNDHNS